MPAKKPAPKAAKGKKAALGKPPAKPAAKKPAAHKRAAEHKAAPQVHHKAEAAAREVRRVAPDAIAHHMTDVVEETRKSGASAPGKANETARATEIAARTRTASLSSAASDGEDSEAIEPGSLLAGPRNVQPYIPKRGEQYMSKEQLDHFRNILNSWKRDLMVEVDRTVSHMKDEAANFPDPSDRATQEEEFSLELRTRDRERKLIRKIDEALKRIEDGTYGYCLETGEEIGIKRLEARPVATLSIEAQERRERREKQYGDRDDRYR